MIDEESTDYWDDEESEESSSTESSTSTGSSTSLSSESQSSLSSEPSSMTGRGRLSSETRIARSRSSQPPIGPRPPRKITLEDE